MLADCVVDLARREVVRSGGATLTLSPIEASLLQYLAERAGTVVSTSALLCDVWGYAPQVASRTVKTTVGRLRSKLERDPASPVSLINVPTVGYVLELPELASSGLIGRRASAAMLTAARAAGARVLTLVGLGGVGKTALARSWATDADWVDLSPARDLAAAVGRLALVLDPAGSSSRAPEARIPEIVGGRTGVLVLDNVEQLGAVAAQLITAIRGCAPSLTLLVTSREPTGADGEHCVSVSPLSTDEGRRLFLDRCAAPPSTDDAAHIDALVRLFGGLPLALELAARRAPLFALSDLVARLGQRVDLLRDPSRDPRHATLDALVGWSIDLLDPSQRMALAALVVCGGPVAPAVLDAFVPDWPDAVDGLVRRSLVVLGSGPSIAPYDVVRRVMTDRGLDPALVRAHGAWIASLHRACARRTDAAATHLRVQAEVLAAASRIEKLDHSDQTAVRAAAALVALQFGDPTAAAGWLRGVTPTDLGDAVDVALLQMAIHRALGDGERTWASATEALALAAEDPRWAGWAAARVAAVAVELGRLDAARDLAEQTLAAAITTGDVGLRVRAHITRSGVRWRTGEQAVEAELIEAAELAAQAGLDEDRSRALSNLGGLLMMLGDGVRAIPVLEEAVAAAQRAGAPSVALTAIVNLASTHRDLGRPEIGLPMLRQALEGAPRGVDRRTSGMARMVLAQTLADFDDFAAAEMHARAAAVALAPFDRAAYAMALAIAGDAAMSLGRQGDGLAAFDEAVLLLAGGDPSWSISVQIQRASHLPYGAGNAALDALEGEADPATRAAIQACRAVLAHRDGRLEEAEGWRAVTDAGHAPARRLLSRLER